MSLKTRVPWLFLTPNLLIFGLFTFLPIIINVFYAFTGGVQLYPQDRPYVGTENLASLLTCGNHFDPATCEKDLFWRAIWNTAYFSVVQVVLMIVFSLITALVLNQKIIGRGFWRGVFFYPVMLSPVVVSLIWKWILQREGLLNALSVYFGGQPVLWLGEPQTAFFWVTFVSIWAYMGFFTLILLSGLQAIPADLYEAAQMDRASPWRRLWRITLPLLVPNMIVVATLGIIRAVQTFDNVFVLTGGGPGSATTFIVQFIYQTGFQDQVRLYGMAAAASLILAVALITLTLIQLRLSKANSAGERAK